jgi:hypothetical protein
VHRSQESVFTYQISIVRSIVPAAIAACGHRRSDADINRQKQ